MLYCSTIDSIAVNALGIFQSVCATLKLNLTASRLHPILRYLSPFLSVVVVGGDGTFTEAATGLLYAAMGKDSPRGPDMVLPPAGIPVGLIPAGKCF